MCWQIERVPTSSKKILQNEKNILTTQNSGASLTSNPHKSFQCIDFSWVPVDDQEVVPISERLMGGL
jgi:hypothetical protein